MATSHERFEEEIRELALLVQGEAPAPRPRAKTPRGKAASRITSPTGLVEAWAWWRRPGPGSASHGAARP